MFRVASAPTLGPREDPGASHSPRFVPLDPPTAGACKFYDAVDPARYRASRTGGRTAAFGLSGTPRLVPLSPPTAGANVFYKLPSPDTYKVTKTGGRGASFGAHAGRPVQPRLDDYEGSLTSNAFLKYNHIDVNKYKATKEGQKGSTFGPGIGKATKPRFDHDPGKLTRAAYLNHVRTESEFDPSGTTHAHTHTHTHTVTDESTLARGGRTSPTRACTATRTTRTEETHALSSPQAVPLAGPRCVVIHSYP